MIPKKGRPRPGFEGGGESAIEERREKKEFPWGDTYQRNKNQVSPENMYALTKHLMEGN